MHIFGQFLLAGSHIYLTYIKAVLVDVQTKENLLNVSVCYEKKQQQHSSTCCP